MKTSPGENQSNCNKLTVTTVNESRTPSPEPSLSPPSTSEPNLPYVEAPIVSSTAGPSNIPCSGEPSPVIVRNLLWHSVYRHQGLDAESFSRRAIESLVKKLKKKFYELDSLIVAVTSKGKQQSKCVTVARTMDGRLQVGEKKDFPHVIYTRL